MGELAVMGCNGLQWSQAVSQNNGKQYDLPRRRGLGDWPDWGGEGQVQTPDVGLASSPLHPGRHPAAPGGPTDLDLIDGRGPKF